MYIFKKNSFKIFIDYSIKTIEKIRALNESHETIQLFSIKAIKSLLQTNFNFIYIWAIHISVKPLFRLGLDVYGYSWS